MSCTKNSRPVFRGGIFGKRDGVEVSLSATFMSPTCPQISDCCFLGQGIAAFELLKWCLWTPQEEGDSAASCTSSTGGFATALDIDTAAKAARVRAYAVLSASVGIQNLEFGDPQTHVALVLSLP